MVTPERKKEKVCAVRLTKKDYAYYKQAAFNARRSLSDIIRITLHDHIATTQKMVQNNAK